MKLFVTVVTIIHLLHKTKSNTNMGNHTLVSEELELGNFTHSDKDSSTIDVISDVNNEENNTDFRAMDHGDNFKTSAIPQTPETTMEHLQETTYAIKITTSPLRDSTTETTRDDELTTTETTENTREVSSQNGKISPPTRVMDSTATSLGERALEDSTTVGHTKTSTEATSKNIIKNEQLITTQASTMPTEPENLNKIVLKSFMPDIVFHDHNSEYKDLPFKYDVEIKPSLPLDTHFQQLLPKTDSNSKFYIPTKAPLTSEDQGIQFKINDKKEANGQTESLSPDTNDEPPGILIYIPPGNLLPRLYIGQEPLQGKGETATSIEPAKPSSILYLSRIALNWTVKSAGVAVLLLAGFKIISNYFGLKHTSSTQKKPDPIETFSDILHKALSD